MEQLKIINEILFNIKHKITDNEYLLLTKNLHILYNNQKKIDEAPMIESQRNLRQYYREEQEQEEPNHSWYVSDTDSNTDTDVESYYNTSE